MLPPDCAPSQEEDKPRWKGLHTGSGPTVQLHSCGGQRRAHAGLPAWKAKLQAAALKTAKAANYRFEVAAKATLDFREIP